MISFKNIFLFFHDGCFILTDIIKDSLKSRATLQIELIALRSQLTLFQQYAINHKIPKPQPTPPFRQLWVLISRILPNWQSALVIVKPETVISWHKKAFKLYWMFKSKQRGRPKISSKTIALIKRLHQENPLWSPERIHDQLLQLGITDAPAPNTIAKYFPVPRKTPSEKRQQSWRIFLANHRRNIWAMDFFTVPTLYFKVLHCFIIVSHDRRKIEHFAVTTQPTSAWVVQQIREATPFDKKPEYLLHDNDSIFTSHVLQEFLLKLQIKSLKTVFHSPWQNGICERTIGILRQELLDYIIPLNEKHLNYLLGEYIQQYYNPCRTHQGIGRQTPILSKKPPGTLITDTVLVTEPILGGLYHNYRKVA